MGKPENIKTSYGLPETIWNKSERRVGFPFNVPKSLKTEQYNPSENDMSLKRGCI